MSLPPTNLAAGFPPFMPDTGERVPSSPAEMIRDVFLANNGRISKVQTANMIGRHTFTYGAKILEAWSDLLASGMWEEDGDDYVNPIQLACCPPSEVSK